jgi:TM2 domain-containing membrane protein YozV
MKRKPFIAGILSLIVPGLGQIYGGESNKGAAIIAAAIVIGNLNIIILPLISMANPVIPPTGTSDAIAIWAYWIPRVGHDVMSFWSIAFWLWAIIDAISVTRKKR